MNTDSFGKTLLELYGLEGKPPFSENERRYMQLLMPNVTAALTGNRMLHLERTRAARGSSGAGSAPGVTDRRGRGLRPAAHRLRPRHAVSHGRRRQAGAAGGR